MDVEEAVQFVRENHHAVFATKGVRGVAQLSPLLAGVDGEGRVVISSRETAVKVKNLQRDATFSLCVMSDRFFGPWVQLHGTAEIVHLPEAMEPLVDYYRRVAGEHPDWDDYRAAMERERRVLIRLRIEHAGPDRHG
jgi:PPOX class probable F420-dependent enzyme